MIGTFGTVVFETGTDTAGNFKSRTWNQFSRSGDARFAQHDVLKGKPRLEFQGPALEEIELKVNFGVNLGLNPLNEINALRAIRDAGKEQRLVIGGNPLGKFVLKSLSENWKTTDGKGNLLSAEVTLKLQEYYDN